MTAPDCPAPDDCPVSDPEEVDLRGLRLAHLRAGDRLHRVHERTYAATVFNRSHDGNTRFAPLADTGHVYLAASRTVALLETVFHDVHHHVPRIIYEATDLAGWQLTEIRLEVDIALLDLRDPQLGRLGIDRDQLVATTPAHYPCTRHWAQVLADRRPGGATPSGLLWHSRVAELATADSVLLDDLLDGPNSQICVLYDTTLTTDVLQPAGPTFDDLSDGQGRLLVEAVAQHIRAEVH